MKKFPFYGDEKKDFFEIVDEEVGGFVDDLLTAIGKAIVDPFKSNPSNPKNDGEHYHCYPCQDDDCNRR